MTTDTIPGGRDWGATADGFRMIIPAGWDVPDAGAVPTDDNRDGLKGTLESAPAKVGDLISAAPPPNPLFAAHGSIGPGLEVGVTVGAYDIGSPATSGSLRKQLLAAGSSAKIDDFTVATSDGLRITPPPGTPPGPGGASVVADYWVGIPHHPNQVAIVRFWQRAGPASSSSGSATREIHDVVQEIIGSFVFVSPVFFRAPIRAITLRDCAPPPAGDRASTGWRFAGFRLGTVYVSKTISEKKHREAEATSRPVDSVIICITLLVFVAGILKLLGFKAGSSYLLVAIFSPLGAFSLAQRYRQRAVLGYVVAMAVVLGVAVVLK